MAYFSEALNRINSIKWSEVGNGGKPEDADLMTEFLRRMGIFSLNNSVKTNNPLLIDIAKELGYEEDIGIENVCKKETWEFLNIYMYLYHLIKSYLKLSKLADTDERAHEYIEVYNPVIRLLERGVCVYFRSGYIEVDNVGSFSISEWKERAKLSSIDISKL